jgi:hypothetical protein
VQVEAIELQDSSLCLVHQFGFSATIRTFNLVWRVLNGGDLNFILIRVDDIALTDKVLTLIPRNDWIIKSIVLVLRAKVELRPFVKISNVLLFSLGFGISESLKEVFYEVELF